MTEFLFFGEFYHLLIHVVPTPYSLFHETEYRNFCISAFKVQYKFLSINAFPGNRTHDLV